jgi:hypothetical protein
MWREAERMATFSCNIGTTSPKSHVEPFFLRNEDCPSGAMRGQHSPEVSGVVLMPQVLYIKALPKLGILLLVFLLSIWSQVLPYKYTYLELSAQ